MNQYFVRCVSDCSECNGAGWVTHPAWSNFPIGADVDEFFSKLGYDYPPDEQQRCGECDGTGRISSEVSLTDALAALAAQ